MKTVQVVDVRKIGGKVVVMPSLTCLWGADGNLTVAGCAEICVFETGDAWMRNRGARFLADQAHGFGAVPTEECVEALVAANAEVIPEVALAAVKRPYVSDEQLLVWARLKPESSVPAA